MLHLILLVLCWIFVASTSSGPDYSDEIKGAMLLGTMFWVALEGVYWATTYLLSIFPIP